MKHHDTIVAVSSPPGRSRRAIIRLSGPATSSILETLTGESASCSRALLCRRLTDPAIPIMAICFTAPGSFTGEDGAELQLPGNAALLDRVLHQAITAGARLAEPGEFTFRAFTSGKLDLTQAEGVAATISATSEGQLRAATMLREGKLGTWSHELVDELATLLALVEAGIDFVDQEDVVPIEPGVLADRLEVVTETLTTLQSKCRSWGELEALPWVVLAGAPSAGKSTLFNALLNRTRAVVHALPGTTRDVLTEPMTLHDKHGQAMEVMLVDVAGTDDPVIPGDALDQEVQAATQRAIERADLILNVLDVTSDQAPTYPGLNVYTKTDLTPGSPEEAHAVTAWASPLLISALTGQGLDVLRDKIADHLAQRAVSLAGDALALQPRHEAAIQAASQYLLEACELLEPQRQAHGITGVELVAGCLRSALDELASLGGQMSCDDVIGRVFATFCVGK